MNAVLPEIPSVEKIRHDPNSFNISLLEVSKMPAEQLKQRFKPSQMLEEIKKIAQLPDGDESGGSQQKQQEKDVEKLLQDDAQLDIQLGLSDLVGSSRALQNKKQKLIDLKHQLGKTIETINACDQAQINLAK